MNYIGYSSCDLANGEGARVSLFVSGCTMRCKGCFSVDSWDFEAGKPFDNIMVNKVLKDLSNSYIKGLSILGGDPLEEKNIDTVFELFKKVNESYPDKTIWLWTGRKKEKVENLPIMKYLDIVISEPFIEKFKFNGKYMGSSNQKIWYAKDGSKYDICLESEHSHKDFFSDKAEKRQCDCDC